MIFETWSLTLISCGIVSARNLEVNEELFLHCWDCRKIFQLNTFTKSGEILSFLPADLPVGLQAIFSSFLVLVK